jgi:hypothetical protein
MHTVHEDFQNGLTPALTRLELGSGRVELNNGLRMIVEATASGAYSDAQIFDYAAMKRFAYPNRSPLRMVVRARASHDAEQLIGTAGFGFWNQPYMPGTLSFRLPRAAWFFFGSHASNMAFAHGVPGFGWKAATLDTSRLPFLLLAPGAPLGFLLMRIPALYRTLWPVGQWAIGAAEAVVQEPLSEPHTYRLDWLPNSVLFYVDNRLILRSPFAPKGPLGFVAWLDNQFAIVTPQGNIQMGLLPIQQQQWLALESLVIEKL